MDKKKKLKPTAQPDEAVPSQEAAPAADESTPTESAAPAPEALGEPAGLVAEPVESTAPEALGEPAELVAEPVEGATETPAQLEAQPEDGELTALGEEDLEAAEREDQGAHTALTLDMAAWEILEERARALARTHDDEEEVLGEEMVVFRLGEGSYSLPARYIREVQPLDSYTPLPSTPAFVVGLVNLRGRLLTALDIRPLLELKHQQPQPGAYLIVVAIGGVEMSLLADAVDEVRQGDTELAPALSTAAGRGLSWVRGIDRDLNLVLDPNGLLSDPRLIVNSEA